MSIKTILTITALVLSFFAGYLFSGYEWSAEMEKEKAERAAEVANLSEQYRSKEHELAKNAKELDQKYTRDLSMAERRISELESSVAAGPKRVFVRAKCPSASAETSTTGSVGDGGAAELADATRQDYLRLVRGIAKQDAQIRYLQDYVKQQCLSGE